MTLAAFTLYTVERVDLAGPALKEAFDLKLSRFLGFDDTGTVSEVFLRRRLRFTVLDWVVAGNVESLTPRLLVTGGGITPGFGGLDAGEFTIDILDFAPGAPKVLEVVTPRVDPGRGGLNRARRCFAVSVADFMPHLEQSR